MTISSVTTNMIDQQSAQNPTGHDAMSELDMDDFLKLMIAELQHQDPLNPMDNTQMLEQISQIRTITSNDRLTDTLAAVLLGQNMSTASSMLGRTIRALTDDGNMVIGTVDRVTIEDGVPKLHITDDTADPPVDYIIDLENVGEIMANPEDFVETDTENDEQ
jgi:flagellar basal-body rod modification protein FlgD